MDQVAGSSVDAPAVAALSVLAQLRSFENCRSLRRTGSRLQFPPNLEWRPSNQGTRAPRLPYSVTCGWLPSWVLS